MSIAQIRNQMFDLGLHGMIANLESVVDQYNKEELDIVGLLEQLTQKEAQYRIRIATKMRVIRSKIRLGASLEDFDFTLSRGLTKAQVRELATLEWCSQGKPLILVGPTGVGKTYLARALGILSCEKGKTSYFLTITDFMENQKIARQTNGYIKFRDKLTRPDILILDDFGMRKFTSQEAEDLRDIIEQRSYGKSTVITTQLPLAHWGEVIGDPVILEALVDRLDPPGITFELKGTSYRRKSKAIANAEISA